MAPRRELNRFLNGSQEEAEDHPPLMAVTDACPCEHETFQI